MNLRHEHGDMSKYSSAKINAFENTLSLLDLEQWLDVGGDPWGIWKFDWVYIPLGEIWKLSK